MLSPDPLYKRYAVTRPKAGSDCLYAHGFRIYFTPLPGFFSPFPHGTGSLSVDHEYLALEDGPPIFRQDFTCPARSEEHTSELQSLMRISYAVFCLKKKKKINNKHDTTY